MNHQTSRSILPSFRHNFDMFINYQQQFIVFFVEKRSDTKPKHSQKYSGNFSYTKAYGKQHLRIDRHLFQCLKKII